ncbi:SDR family oxidoreductase [Lentzea guizhouensis]|uniref:SDR family oxidoreductase n=1 Tax=Lentzea guizhouensis TaxID=1586287 RepID=UPI000AD10621|nr:SDR family oxidoreductase [Lentzea guizhouensis]
MWTSLQGTWCLVLGASSGMGLATAQMLARAGVNVVGVHFDMAEAAEKVQVAVEELRAEGVQAHYFNVNAASTQTRATLIPKIRQLTGGAGVHVLLHSLAFGTLLPFVRWADEPVINQRQLDMTLNVMAHSLVYWTQDLHAAGLLPEGAKVFAMTSDGNRRVTRHYGAVSAAKSALEAHVRQLAVELAPSGVAVNAIRAGSPSRRRWRRSPTATTCSAGRPNAILTAG